MTTALLIVLVDRPARAQPDRQAFAASGDTGRQLLKLRLEQVQPTGSVRLMAPSSPLPSDRRQSDRGNQSTIWRQ
jgi:hypothetical protein